MKSHILLNILFGLSFFINLNAQDEAYICRYLFASSDEVTQLSADAISLAVDAVWEASGITGVVTTTGTLTQNPVNPDIWTYSPTPNDKLILNFSNGVSVVFTFYTITGYTGGTADDFKKNHQMDFSTYIQSMMNMRINSNTYPQSGKTYWQRSITGTAVFDSQTMNLNINHNGNIEYDIGSGFAFYKYTEQATGTTSTGSFSVNVNEGYWRHIGYNSNPSYNYNIINTEITNNSSGNFGGTTYQYQNGYVFWATQSHLDSGYINRVIDAGQWSAQGTMLKNGQQYGALQFDGPVINGTYGPNLILHLNSGSNIFIHTLINFPVSVDEERDPHALNNFTVLQNYPNPFNSSTTIHYKISTTTKLTIKIFNAFGEEVITLLDNEEKTEGAYDIKWNAENLASGVYFCRIYSNKSDKNDVFKTIKMILLK